MFKKPFKASSQPLKGKDVKALKKAVQELYPTLKDEALLLLLFPAKEEVTLHKIHSHLLYYSVAGDPMFFDTTGRMDLYPTVYAMWKCPELCPAVYVPSPVSTFVFGGADIMLPGIVRRAGTPGPFLANDKRCVVVIGNKYPIAVGEMLLSSTEANKAGWKGKGLKVLHSTYDCLWQVGSKVTPEGYHRDVVTALPSVAEGHSSNEVAEDDGQVPSELAGDSLPPGQSEGVPVSDEDGTPVNMGTNDGNGEKDPNEVKEPAATAEESVAVTAGKDEETAVHSETDSTSHSEEEAHSSDSSGKDKNKKQKGKKKKKGKKGEAQPSGTPVAVDYSEADRQVLEAFIWAMSRFKDDSLPILVSDFFEKHLKPSLPEGVVLDWKKTSYKKATGFLKEMSALQLCTTRDKHGLFHIMTFSRGAPIFAETMAVIRDRPRPAPEPPKQPTKQDLKRQFREGLVQVESLYRPTASTKPLFENDQKDRLYTAAECGAILAEYIQREGLDPSVTDKSQFRGRKTRIKIDDYLHDTLYGKKVDSPEAEELMALEQKFCDCLQQWHRIKHPDSEPIIGKGKLKPIQLITEMRQGKKVVTRCLNLDEYGFDLPSLQSALQKKFASSVIIPPPIGGSKGSASLRYELLAQGHMVNQWADYLLNVLHIPKQFVEVCDKVRQ